MKFKIYFTHLTQRRFFALARHPEHTEGSPGVQEMFRKARHDEFLWCLTLNG